MKTDLLSPRADDPETALGLLQACHERIRRFCKLAVELPDAAAPDEQIVDAAESLYKYFGTALPLHAQDEDVSVKPRLLERGFPKSIFGAITSQHDQLNEELDALLLRWQMIADKPSRRDGMRDKLAEGAQRIERLLHAHIAMEEEKLFPAMEELLTADDDKAIVAEIRQRRQ